MAYKNKAITNLVDKAYLFFQYRDNNNTYRYYDRNLDITIETISDLGPDKSLTIIFKFTIPPDFPSPDTISKVYRIEIWLYHSEDGYYYPGCIYVGSNSIEQLFGQNLEPGKEAKLIFTIPPLYFDMSLRQTTEQS